MFLTLQQAGLPLLSPSVRGRHGHSKWRGGRGVDRDSGVRAERLPDPEVMRSKVCAT